MRAKDAARLSTIRLLLAAIKQREVDERKELTDADVLAIIDKMIKQRRDSIAQFEAGKREDLAAIERPRSTVLAGLHAAAAHGRRDRRADRRGDRRRPAPPGAAGHGQGDGRAEAASSPGAPTWARCRRRSRPSSPVELGPRAAGAASGRDRAQTVCARPPSHASPIIDTLPAVWRVRAAGPRSNVRPHATLPQRQADDPQRFHPDAAVPRRHRRSRRPLRPAQEGRRELRRPAARSTARRRRRSRSARPSSSITASAAARTAPRSAS